MSINDDAVEHSARITLVSQTACIFNEFANDSHRLERLNSQVFWHFECHKYSYSEFVFRHTVWHQIYQNNNYIVSEIEALIAWNFMVVFFLSEFIHIPTYIIYYIRCICICIWQMQSNQPLNKHGKCYLFAWLRPHSAAIQF